MNEETYLHCSDCGAYEHTVSKDGPVAIIYTCGRVEVPDKAGGWIAVLPCNAALRAQLAAALAERDAARGREAKAYERGYVAARTQALNVVEDAPLPKWYTDAIPLHIVETVAEKRDQELVDLIFAMQPRDAALASAPANDGAEVVSGIPCSVCRGDCIEFTVPNDIWNLVVRKGGHETDKEYLCEKCYREAVTNWVRSNTRSALAAAPSEAGERETAFPKLEAICEEHRARYTEYSQNPNMSLVLAAGDAESYWRGRRDEAGWFRDQLRLALAAAQPDAGKDS